MKTTWLILAVLGAVLPMAVFFGAIPSIPAVEGGLLTAFFANRAAAAASTDVLWASVVFWVWIVTDYRQCGQRFPWWLVPVNMLVGLCAAIPLYFWRREPAAQSVPVSASPS